MGNSRLESSGQRQQSFRIRGAKPNLSVPGKTSKKMTSASGYWFKFPDPSYRIHAIDLHVEKCDRNVFEFQYCMGRSMQFSQDKKKHSHFTHRKILYKPFPNGWFVAQFSTLFRIQFGDNCPQSTCLAGTMCNNLGQKWGWRRHEWRDQKDACA